jgi:hypothetical protein
LLEVVLLTQFDRFKMNPPRRNVNAGFSFHGRAAYDIEHKANREEFAATVSDLESPTLRTPNTDSNRRDSSTSQ